MPPKLCLYKKADQKIPKQFNLFNREFHLKIKTITGSQPDNKKKWKIVPRFQHTKAYETLKLCNKNHIEHPHRSVAPTIKLYTLNY